MHLLVREHNPRVGGTVMRGEEPCAGQGRDARARCQAGSGRLPLRVCGR